MAFDQTAPGDVFGMVALNGATEVSLTLDPRYQHKIVHSGAGADGTADANSQKSAWLSTLSATITADKTVEDLKHELLTSTSETFGPGIAKLYIVSTAGADAVLKVVRLGTPTGSY